MPKPTRIWTEVDYAKPGKQVGWLNLPHSVTRSAYGNIMIPIAVVSGGRGPTGLFRAGNHGDPPQSGRSGPKRAVNLATNQAGLLKCRPGKSCLPT